MPTIPASSTTTSVAESTAHVASRNDRSAFATVIPVSPAPSRTATSTAAPVGANTTTRRPPPARCAAARRAFKEVVLPAPAGADNGAISHGEDPTTLIARA